MARDDSDAVVIASPRKVLSLSSPASPGSSLALRAPAAATVMVNGAPLLVVPREPLYHCSPVCYDPCAVCAQRSVDSMRPRPTGLQLEATTPSAVICEACYWKHEALQEARAKRGAHDRAYVLARICLDVKERDGELPERPKDFAAMSSIGGLWPQGHNPEAATRVLL